MLTSPCSIRLEFPGKILFYVDVLLNFLDTKEEPKLIALDILLTEFLDLASWAIYVPQGIVTVHITHVL